MIACVYGIPGRVEYLRQTLTSLQDAKVWIFWHGNWELGGDWPTSHVLTRMGDSRGGDVDYWDAIRYASQIAPGEDILMMEDDIVACRNFVPYVDARRAFWKHVTTFYNLRRWPEGPRPIPVEGFWGSQALVLPSRLVPRICAADPIARRPRPDKKGGCQDIVLGNLLKEWEEPISVHRSLVRHIGVKSICNPGASLTGARAPAKDYVGDDFDALTLLAP